MITLRSLTKRYGALTAVESLSLELLPGEILCLFGPNGSGKSTTLKAIAGLVRPTSGEVLINGVPLDPNRSDLRKLVGYLPQRIAFDEHMKVREILRLYAGVRGVSLDEMRRRAASFGIADLEDRTAGKLSGGQSQRLGLSVALAGDPPVWLLDEPTASLDATGATELRAMISRHRETGGAVLLSTHLVPDVEQLADRVAIIHEGKLAALRSDRELRDALVGASTLVVTLRNPDRRFYDVVKARGAVIVRAENGTMEIAAPLDERLDLLKALDAEGARLERFSVRTPTIDRIIAEWTKGAEDARV